MQSKSDNFKHTETTNVGQKIKCDSADKKLTGSVHSEEGSGRAENPKREAIVNSW